MTIAAKIGARQEMAGYKNISHVPQSQMWHGCTHPDGPEQIVTTELANRPIFDHRSQRLFGNDDPCLSFESSHTTSTITFRGLRMVKLAIGCALSVVIGATCRWVDIPLPSPPKLQGALLVVAMTLGYLGTDWVISKKIPSKGPATTQPLCGGPTGLPTTPKTPFTR